MLRISAIFIAACMVLIAGSVGIVVYLRFGFTGAESALVALGALTALAVYNAIAARKHDRLEASNQLANLARGSDDLARQLAEFGRRLGAMEGKVDTVIDRALATAQPLAAEIEEMSTLVKQLANSVATHEAALNAERRRRRGRAAACGERCGGRCCAGIGHCYGRSAPAACNARRRQRRSSVRLRPSPGLTATASLPPSQEPSTQARSIFTCSRW